MDYKKRPGKNITTIGDLLNKNIKPTISIITPFYNGGETLLETANSVISQTYPFFEWIQFFVYYHLVHLKNIH